MSMDLLGSLATGCQAGAAGLDGVPGMAGGAGAAGTFDEAMAQVVVAGLGSDKAGEAGDRAGVEVLDDPDLLALLLGGSGLLPGRAAQCDLSECGGGDVEELLEEALPGGTLEGDCVGEEVGALTAGGARAAGSVLEAGVRGGSSEGGEVAGQERLKRDVARSELPGERGEQGTDSSRSTVVDAAADGLMESKAVVERGGDGRVRSMVSGIEPRGGESGGDLEIGGAEPGDQGEGQAGDGDVVERVREHRDRSVVVEGERLAMARVRGGGLQRAIPEALGGVRDGFGGEGVSSEQLGLRAAESAGLVTGLDLRGRILPGQAGSIQGHSVDLEGVKEDGTAVAQEEDGMKTMRKAEESATWGVQKLPGSGAGMAAADGGNLARLHMDRQGVLSLEIKVWDWMQRVPEVQVPVSDVASAEGASGVRGVSALERVEQLIVREVMVVRQMKADSLTVVLRPDDRTEMVLQLNRKDGQLEAFVRCEPKAYEAFQRNWGQLQESMLQHQVQLLPLKATPVTQYQPSAENMTEQGGNGSEFAGRSSQREEEGGERERRGLRGLTLEEEGSGLRRPVRVGHSRGTAGVSGWESWA